MHVWTYARMHTCTPLRWLVAPLFADLLVRLGISRRDWIQKPPRQVSVGFSRLGSSSGISSFGHFVWVRLFVICSLGSFVWDLSLGIFRLGTFAWDRSFGNFRLGSFAWELWLGVVRFETFAWELSLGNFRLDISLGHFRLRPFALKHSLGIFRLGTFAWDLSLDIFRLGCFAWELSFRIFRSGTFAQNIAGSFACSFALNASLGIFHLKPFGIVRLETSSRLRQSAGFSVWIVSLGIFR